MVSPTCDGGGLIVPNVVSPTCDGGGLIVPNVISYPATCGGGKGLEEPSNGPVLTAVSVTGGGGVVGRTSGLRKPNY